jgi:hypothetical protein
MNRSFREPAGCANRNFREASHRGRRRRFPTASEPGPDRMWVWNLYARALRSAAERDAGLGASLLRRAGATGVL